MNNTTAAGRRAIRAALPLWADPLELDEINLDYAATTPALIAAVDAVQERLRLGDGCEERIDLGPSRAEPDARANGAGNRDVLATLRFVEQPGRVIAPHAEQVRDERMRAERSCADGDPTVRQMRSQLVRGPALRGEGGNADAIRGVRPLVQLPHAIDRVEPVPERTREQPALSIYARSVRRHGEIVQQRRKEAGVEFLALVYGDPDTWGQLSEEQRNAAYEGYVAVSRDATAAGALVDASELESTAAATSVRVRNGDPVVTDGPYAEVKESLGGYYLFSCDSLEDAIAWAAKIPAAWTGGAIEVRPVHVGEEEAA